MLNSIRLFNFGNNSNKNCHGVPNELRAWVKDWWHPKIPYNYNARIANPRVFSALIPTDELIFQNFPIAKRLFAIRETFPVIISW